jgi:hypothetical protein
LRGVSKDGPRQNADTSYRSRGAKRPSFSIKLPSREQRAQGRPGARRTHGPRATKKHAAEPQVRAGTTGLPCAMVYGLYVVSPVNRAFLPPSPCRSSPAKLSASVGAPGPHDFAVRTDIVRLTLPIRPSHPALAFVTTRTPLLSRRDARELAANRTKKEAQYFSSRDWTTQISLESLRKISVFTHSISPTAKSRRTQARFKNQAIRSSGKAKSLRQGDRALIAEFAPARRAERHP